MCLWSMSFWIVVRFVRMPAGSVNSYIARSIFIGLPATCTVILALAIFS